MLRVVSMNFNTVNKARLSMILGWFQCAFFSDSRDSCENISFRICRSGKRKKSFGNEATAAMKPTVKHTIHLLETYGNFERILNERNFEVKITKNEPKIPDIIPKKAYAKYW